MYAHLEDNNYQAGIHSVEPHTLWSLERVFYSQPQLVMKFSGMMTDKSVSSFISILYIAVLFNLH